MRHAHPSEQLLQLALRRHALRAGQVAQRPTNGERLAETGGREKALAANVILALPPNVGQTFPFMHCHGSPSAQRGVPKEGEPMPFERLVNDGPLEAFRVARPEAVGLETC